MLFEDDTSRCVAWNCESQDHCWRFQNRPTGIYTVSDFSAHKSEGKDRCIFYIPVEEDAAVAKSDKELAYEVMTGAWGDTVSVQKRRLMQAGYDWRPIQELVNACNKKERY